ncbi:MAG TPA: ROK family protein [Chloroflexia bacterium]|nr:ROK family protein [Chloroflexia bacterium]
MADYVIGVDLGGTKIMTARCDRQGTVLAQVRESTPASEGVDAVIGCMVDSVADVLVDADPVGLIGVGVVAPGPMDPATGVLYNAPNLPGWDRVPLRAIMTARLSERLGRPIRVATGNDANGAALGEYYFGLQRTHPELHHVVYMTVSTGIGGGVIIDGRVFAGAHGMAAELGHITVDMHGPRCGCGNIGCVEALAAGPAITRRGAALVAAGKAPLLTQLVAGEPEAVTTRLVEDAARAGDPDVLDLITQVSTALGVAVVNAVHMYNPQVVVIGGGVAKMGALLLDPLEATVRARAMPSFLLDFRILPATLGDYVGVLGAAALAFKDLPSLTQ